MYDLDVMVIKGALDSTVSTIELLAELSKRAMFSLRVDSG
jgi:hypothetical protein